LREQYTRFDHYNQRFVCHTHGREAGAQARAKARKKIVRDYERQMLPQQCAELLQRADRALDIARETVTWCYPYAFFMDAKSSTGKLFELAQADLELLAEKVGWVLERYNGEPPGTLERFVPLLEHHTEVVLRQADSFAV
jgi:hypothetical protein